MNERPPERVGVIDVGTNSVLLLVAEGQAPGEVTAVVERAEITRLGRGVDRTGALSPDAIEETVSCIARFAEEARALGCASVEVIATSAARDASNGEALREAVATRAKTTLEILSGDREAELSYLAARVDVGDDRLAVLDIGGGSTELVLGACGSITFRHSFDVGSVRLTERMISAHPVAPVELDRVRARLRETFAGLPRVPADATVVGIAGTVTTLFCIDAALEPFDPDRVRGSPLTRATVQALSGKLAGMGVEERSALPGLPARRADVIVAGALILDEALGALGADRCIVSDRGIRWGLARERLLAP